MPVPDNFDARDRAHVSIDTRRERATYAFPSRGQRRKPLRDDYPAHAVQLLNQLAQALGNVMPANERLNIEGLKPGSTFGFEFVERKPGEWVITSIAPSPATQGQK